MKGTKTKKVVNIGSIALGILALIYVGSIYFFRGREDDTVEIGNKTGLCYQDYCFDTELARTSQERMQGLMYREYLPEMSGMLFVFDQTGVYSFWMKNTLIPLDMVWLDRNFKVIDIKYAIPCTQDTCTSYKPQGEASYVFEINGGMSQQIGLKIGENFVSHNLNF